MLVATCVRVGVEGPGITSGSLWCGRSRAARAAFPPQICEARVRAGLVGALYLVVVTERAKRVMCLIVQLASSMSVCTVDTHMATYIWQIADAHTAKSGSDTASSDIPARTA